MSRVKKYTIMYLDKSIDNLPDSNGWYCIIEDSIYIGPFKHQTEAFEAINANWGIFEGIENFSESNKNIDCGNSCEFGCKNICN